MTAAAIMRKILVWGAYLAVGVAVVGGVTGWLIAGGSGVISALVGTAIAIVFTMLTAASILLGYRLSHGRMISGAFFGVVLGGWLVKFVVFLLLVFLVREQGWLHPGVAFGTIVVAIIGSLVVDIAVITTSRQLTVDETDPEDETQGRPARR